MQVRFPDSPLLGLEDWPTRRRPTEIEQASEPLQLLHPVDPVTGERRPARLLIKLVAPDFTIEGQAQLLFEVPLGEYSKRLAFLVTPKRAGYCRINVEVYAPDALYLGAIAVEAEAVAEGIAEPILRVASLVLGVFSRQPSAIPPDYDPRAAEATSSPRQLPTAGSSPPDSKPRTAQLSPRADVRSSSRGWVRRMMIGAPVVIAAIGGGLLLMQRRTIDVDPVVPGEPRAPAVAPVPTNPPPPRLGGSTSVATTPALSSNALAIEARLRSALMVHNSSNYPGVGVMVMRAERPSPSRLRLSLYFVNVTAESVPLSIDYSLTQLSREDGTRFPVVRDAVGTTPEGRFSATIPEKVGLEHWIEFEESSAGTGNVTAVLVPAEGQSSARFPAFSLALPDR